MEAKFFGGRGQGEGVRIVSRRISLPKLKVSEFRIKILSILIEVARCRCTRSVPVTPLPRKTMQRGG